MTREERAEAVVVGLLGKEPGYTVAELKAALVSFADAEAAAMRERAAEWMAKQVDVEGHWSLAQCIRALPATA